MNPENSNRNRKIELLKKVMAGELKPIDLLSGSDSFFLKVGKFYVRDGVRFSEDQFKALELSFNRKQIPVEIICLKESETMTLFLNENTRPL
jgi:hypothetical protein